MSALIKKVIIMECNINNRDELIAKYLAGELTAEESGMFEEHYFQCEACFKDLRMAEDAIELAGTEKSALKKNGLHKKERRGLFLPIPKWGVALVSVAAVLVLVFILTRNNQRDMPDISPGTAEYGQENNIRSEQQGDENIVNDDLALTRGPAFEPSPYFEEWITENLRSADDIIESVSSPKIGETFHNEKLIFRWTQSEEQQLTLKILDNREEEIFTGTTGSKSLTIGSETFPQSGLYYWKLENQDEVLYVGKFQVIK